MPTFSSLIKETAIYGLSSMVGRFLNWLLTFVYVRVLIPEEFGRMSNLYAWSALLLIILTYGMETAFFRFTSKHPSPRLVYGTALGSLGITSVIFVSLGCLFLDSISKQLQIEDQPGLVLALMVIIAIDAFASIPLGYLRYRQRPWRFMAVRLGFVVITIGLTLGVFYLIPWLSTFWPIISQWYNASNALYYIFGINLVGNIMMLGMLMPTLREAEWKISWPLLKEMLGYAWPILLLGLVGSFSNQADKILFPLLISDKAEGMRQLGIYSASYKLAVVMVLFTQAFRYAYDPFVFARSKEGGMRAKKAYADAMRYYVLFTLTILLGVISLLDLVKLLILPEYYEGLPAVLPLLVGQLMFGIYFNLSIWYKLTDRTWWGAVLSIIGCLLTITTIIWGAEHYGFMICAWAQVIANGLLMVVSYLLGQRYYPIRYPVARLLGYGLVAALLIGIQYLVRDWLDEDLWRIILGGICTSIFVMLVVWREIPTDTWSTLTNRLKR